METFFVYVIIIAVAIFAARTMLRSAIAIKPQGKPLLRKGKPSYLYFHLNPHAQKIKYGFAGDPAKRLRTHQTSNEDLIPIAVYLEIEGVFEEGILKRFYGGDEQIPIDENIKKVIEDGTMKHLL